jgi:uncharacterized membrane protein
MRSKAHFKSHPLHPILVAFPIAFFTGTFLFHLAGWLWKQPGLLQTAYYLNIAGIGFGLLAAIPGLIRFSLYGTTKKFRQKKSSKTWHHQCDHAGDIYCCLFFIAEALM